IPIPHSSMNGNSVSNVGSMSSSEGSSPGSWESSSPQSSSPPPLSLVSPSWVNNFRDVYKEDRHFAKHWFWDNFHWDRQSMWIGKFNKTNNLPDNNQQINNFLKRLVNDLDKYSQIKSEIYI